jgi:hypothetical protein
MKKIVALSLVTIATLGFSSDLESRVSKLEKSLSKVRAHGAGDNIKWDIDFRSSVDKLTYTYADGTEAKNNNLLTNRLWLGFKFAPSSNVSFYGRLSYLKAFGAETNNNQRSSAHNGNFDWLTNENAQGDNNINVKEAYWLYKNSSFLGNKDISWTASVGRRPSTDGFLANFREDQNRKSALAHTVNVEFDGASMRWNLDKVTPLTGSWIKLCMGRGITNARPRFSGTDVDYSRDNGQEANSNMMGFIFVPYDNGQYSLHTNYAHANNLVGFANGTDARANDFKSFGSMTYMTAAFVADGIGDEISDFLDNTIFFASYAQSETDPDGGKSMLGSANSEKGDSTWVGIQMPCLLSSDGRVGFEWNKGDKYWRSMTYAEDTMIGSKVGARGTAIEAYYHKPLTKSLSFSVRYTKIDYDYTGSNGFFGNYSGTPMTIDEAVAAGQNPVEEAEDIRAYIRYRY